MSIRTFATAVLALGLLSPISAIAGETSVNCSQEQSNRSDYVDCDAGGVQLNSQFPAAIVGKVDRASIGDFIDETTAERNQRTND